MKKAIITGAGGFIGGALAESLLKKNITVYGVDIRKGYMAKLEKYQNFKSIVADLSTASLSQHFNDDIDVLFALSWGGRLGGSDLYDTALQARNIASVGKICEDSVVFCKHFIFVSSSYEYMKKVNSDIPVNIYGIAKRTASDICASVCLRNNIKFNKAVLTNTFGVGDKSDKAVNTIIRGMLNNTQLKFVEGTKPNDWVYIDDTVNGLLKIAEHGKLFESYYIGHRNITTLKEKIIAMNSVISPHRTLKFGELHEDTYIDYSQIDLEKLYKDTGFECTADFKESILKTAEWLKNDGIVEDKQMENNPNGGG